MNIGFLFSGLFELDRGIQIYNRNLLQAVSDVMPDSHIELFILHDSENDVKYRKLLERNKLRVNTFNGSKIKFIFRTIRSAKSFDFIFMTHISFSKLIKYMRLFGSHAKIAIAMHGIEVWRKISPLEKTGVERADFLMPVSNFTFNKFCEYNSVDAAKARLVPNILDPFWKELDYQQVDLLKDKKFVLTVSHLTSTEKYKGVDDLIEAFGRLANKSLYLVVAGGGDDIVRLQQITRSHSILDRVIFLGKLNRNELKWLYSRCEFFALPSSGEGFGIVYLEAFSEGKSVIACRNCGAEEVVRDMENGLLVNYGDKKGLIKALKLLDTNVELRIKLGASGKNTLQERFSYGNLCERVKGLLLGLLVLPFYFLNL